jgi:DNA polymerase-3 subunit chi
MTEVRFYHLERSALEAVLPKLLGMCLDRAWRAVVLTGSPERASALSEHLWTHDDRGFLPHGDASDGHADQQPIWITHEDENPNGAKVLFLTDGAGWVAMAGFDLVCRLFDGRDSDAVAAARAAWKAEKEAGHALTYWQQTDRGWEKKAETGANAAEPSPETTENPA